MTEDELWGQGGKLILWRDTCSALGAGTVEELATSPPGGGSAGKDRGAFVGRALRAGRGLHDAGRGKIRTNFLFSDRVQKRGHSKQLQKVWSDPFPRRLWSIHRKKDHQHAKLLAKIYDRYRNIIRSQRGKRVAFQRSQFGNRVRS